MTAGEAVDAAVVAVGESGDSWTITFVAVPDATVGKGPNRTHEIASLPLAECGSRNQPDPDQTCTLKKDRPMPGIWDKRDDETPEAYARFLTFRNLGPGRSLVLAQRCHGTARAGKKSQSASGGWTDQSSRFAWQDRAIAWDIHQLSKHGETLATAWMAVLVNAVRKAAQKLADPKFGPKTFRDVLAVIGAVGAHMTPEVLGPIIARQRDPEPPDSCPLDRMDGFRPVVHREDVQ